MGTVQTLPLTANLSAFQQNKPDLLEQYSQLAALKQQQQMQPLQLQAAQQQVQSGAADLQIKQQQIKDQQAMQATMQQWSQPKSASGTSTSSAPNYDDLVPLAIKNGASFQTVQGLQQHVLQMKAQAATIAMNDARAGASNADALKTKNGIITDAMQGVINAPDAQLPQAIAATAQQLSQQGLFDPQHVQQAQQLAQLAQTDPAQARQQITLQANSMGAFSKLLENAQKQVQVQQEQGKSDPNSPFFAPSEAAVALGTAPGTQAVQQGEIKLAGAKAGAESQARLPAEEALARLHEANENYRAQLSRQTTLQNSTMLHGLNQIDQYSADPQHGYAQYVSQSNAVKNDIQSAKSGNQVAASMEPLMLALGVSSFAGVHRINSTEINQAGPQVGSIYRKINNFVSTLGSGKPTDAQLNEANSLVDDLTNARHESYLNSVKVIAANTGVDPNKVMVFDKSGNMAPLNSVASPQPNKTQNMPPPKPGMIRATDPNGVLHEAPAGTPLPQGWKAQ